jgi:hypothetical protein
MLEDPDGNVGTAGFDVVLTLNPDQLCSEAMVSNGIALLADCCSHPQSR